ncbi:MAG TPA: DUF4192 domain-containing protein [Lapillicoccus sp.]|nr:DUF4192 domain-containing protein [Lapillicoccus sp.]
MTTTIRLRGPADIITVLPYHLGYRPAESLVVVCLMRNRIGVVGRIDLPPPDVDPDLVAVELLPIVRRERPDAVVLVGFESTHGQAEPASVAMRDAIESAGIRVVERLVVRDGRWWSLDCDRDCCPAEGEPVQTDDEVPAVSDYIVRGRRPAGSRADLAARLAHRPEPAQDRRCAAFINDLATARRSRSALQRRRRRMLQDWARILDLTPSGPDAVAAPPPRDDEAWAWAVVSLLDVAVRDLLIAWLCPGTLDLEVFPASLRRLAESVLPPRSSGTARDARDARDARAAPVAEDAVEDTVEDAVGEGLVDRLAMVCRAAPPELSPGPLTVLAHVVWWQGDGALARTALDQALAVDPDYRLAALLERMVDVAARPRATA